MLLVKLLSPAAETGVHTIGAREAVVGAIIAALVLLPDGRCVQTAFRAA